MLKTGSSWGKQGGATKAQQEHHPMKKDLTPWAGSSGADQAAGAAAPRIGSSRHKRRPGPPHWIIRGRRPVRAEAGPVIRV